jgi:hypothetical protein
LETGSGFQTTLYSALKIAAVAPMPSAGERTAVSANPGLRRMVRNP